MVTPGRIALVPVEDAASEFPYVAESSAVVTEPETVLRFRLTATDPLSLEALRYARRAMIREEATRGLDEGEASFESAVFSATEIIWAAPPRERDRCMRKLAELLARANLALEELRRQPEPPVPASARPSPGARIRS